MLCCSTLFRRNYRLSLKYPALVSYNKLPWETLAPDSPQLHRFLAPLYQHILTLAATTLVPRLMMEEHPQVSPAERMRVMPGLLYLMRESAGSTSSSSSPAGLALPDGFASHLVLDTVSKQFYGPMEMAVGPVRDVHVLTSDDLQLLGLALRIRFTRCTPLPNSSLQSPTQSSSTTPLVSLFHFFRPHRSPAEVTHPLQRFLAQHRPAKMDLLSFACDAAEWCPKLQPPSPEERFSSSATESPVSPTPSFPRASMAPYAPPQSYLMGLAERLAVRPGDCFGRRSLMWGHWF